MTATNHALTGALIGLSLANPLALPIALLSHFVLDGIPHFGGNHPGRFIGTSRFLALLCLDAALCFLLVCFLFVMKPSDWLLLSGCALLATSPDFMWVPKFLRARRGEKEPKPTNSIVKFHTVIQWFQRPIGVMVEIVWFIGAFSLLVKTV